MKSLQVEASLPEGVMIVSPGTSQNQEARHGTQNRSGVAEASDNAGVSRQAERRE